MLKRLAPLFLFVLIGGLILPLVASADGSYGVTFYVDDYPEGGNGQFDPGKELPLPRTLHYQGFVPCGQCVKIEGGDLSANHTDTQQCGVPADSPTDTKYVHCQLCHLFVMIDEMIAFVLINIVPPLAVLMFVIGGIMFYFGGAKPELLSRGRTLIKTVAIGLALIYGAYMIIGIALTLLGAASIGPVKEVFQHGVFSIQCSINIPIG